MHKLFYLDVHEHILHSLQKDLFGGRYQYQAVQGDECALTFYAQPEKKSHKKRSHHKQLEKEDSFTGAEDSARERSKEFEVRICII